MIQKQSMNDIAEIIKSYDDILIASHTNPDGDAIGASCAMGYILKHLGKNFCMYNHSGFPQHFDWLKTPSRVLTSIYNLPFKPKLVICLDCGDMWRLGNDLAENLHNYDSINIDHHIDNPLFGRKGNFVDPNMAATGQIVALLAEALNIELKDELAKYLYISISADTGNFRFGNTSSKVINLLAKLSENGLNISELRESLESQWTMSKIKLWGILFSKIYLEAAGKIAVCSVSLEDLKTACALQSEIEFFVEQMRLIRGVKVAMFTREDFKNKVKISLRSHKDYDIQKIAASFGGGGHKNAAGFNLDKNIFEAEELIIPLIKEIL